MKYIKKYLETVIKIKPLGKLTTKDDELNGMSGEMVYIDGKCSDIFISHADYANWLENKYKVDAIEGLETEFEKQISHLIASSINKEYNYNVGYVKYVANSLLNYAKKELCKHNEQNPDDTCDSLIIKNKEFPASEKRDFGYFDESTDKTEPKFHEGDWTVSNLDGKARQISEVHFDEYNSYYVVNGMPVNLEEFDRRHRLWSIADARDGDILSNGKMIVIFKNFEEPSYRQHIIAYIGLDNFGRIQVTNEHWELGIDKAKPATKEQCDLLFQKMREYGCKWNVEKKELKEIHTIDEGKAEMDHCFTKMMNGEKVSSTWSEDDEAKLKSACALIRNTSLNGNEDIVNSTINWLKCIKNRVQPKQDWSEEDKSMYVRTLGILGKCYMGKLPTKVEEELNWFKSIGLQKQWKPSYEQMEALWCAAEKYLESDDSNVVELRGKVLESLYNELKKYVSFDIVQNK